MIEAFYLLRMDGKSVQSRQVMLTGGEAAGLMASRRVQESRIDSHYSTVWSTDALCSPRDRCT